MSMNCTNFSQNAWKKDLCSNCFRTLSEHKNVGINAGHPVLGGQDSLTQLQQGTNRYLTLTNNPLSSRNVKLISKWNDTVFQDQTEKPGNNTLDTDSFPQINTKLQDTLDSLNTLDKPAKHGRKNSLDVTDEPAVITELNMKDSPSLNPSHTVIQRLDSLVLGTPLSSKQQENRSEKHVSGKIGILKDSTRDKSGSEKKRGITFPDYEELQEIIGYGGECYYSSEGEDDEESFPAKPDTDYSEELTQEERNVINITKKNTTFNSHSQNLKESPTPQVKLGQEKKHTPVISVRPFVREQTPGKVNMVSPMINGELVKTKPETIKSLGRENKLIVRKLSHDECGRGEVKINKTDSLGSDGSTENSSDSDSNIRDTPSPQSVPSYHGIRNESELFSSSRVEDEKKSSAAVARLSSLNKSVTPTVELSSTSQSQDVTKYSDEPGSKMVPRKANSTARLSFLSSTVSGSPGPEMSCPDPENSCSDIQTKPELNSSSDNEGSSSSQPRILDTESVSEKAPQNPIYSAEKSEPVKSPVPKDTPRVKLTRKSPYVVGQSTSILRGTPKPMITRKPPILKDKPKVPVKPNKLIMRSPSSSPSPHDHTRSSLSPVARENRDDASPVSVRPVPAPRTASFRQNSEYVNLTISQGRENKSTSGSSIKTNESDSIEIDPISEDTEEKCNDSLTQNALIISVPSCGTTETKRIQEDFTGENSPPLVQKKLGDKNKEALDAIRKSLSNKLISSAPPPRVVESIRASNNGLDFLSIQQPLEKKISNSFEETRAVLEESLHFSRHDISQPNTKRQAPQPPPDCDSAEPVQPVSPPPEQSDVNDKCKPSSSCVDVKEDDTKILDPEPLVQPTPKLTPAIRNSSMKSEISNKTRDNKLRTVQFSPDTLTVTVPIDRTPKIISYNRWMGKNPYLESSFTGQPIAMLPPGVISPPTKKPLVPYPTTPVIDDVPRKWTEKKKKWRSKSTPRSSEIDELMGSSKTKAPNRLAIFTGGSPGPARRQSRVEIYESEKRIQKKGKFSLKNLFKPQNEALNETLPNKFIDKEHEREILERQRGKSRPEIIHPLDLQNGGVEVVKITPKNSVKGQFDKNKLSISNSKPAVQRNLDLKTKIDVDGKDSGHDTSSIHTETSEDTGTCSGSGDYSSSSADYPANLANLDMSPIGMVMQPEVEHLTTHHISSSILGVNSAGKPKPAPPPRSQSLEVFDKFDDDRLFFPSTELSRSVDPLASPRLSDRSPSLNPRDELNLTLETVYANLGSQRSNLAPNKPQRTGSIRDSSAPVISATPPSAPPPPPSVTQSSNAYMLPMKLSIGDLSFSQSLLNHPPLQKTTSDLSPLQRMVSDLSPFPKRASDLKVYHMKTDSLTSESPSTSDSTISLPSSEHRKNGSEADSERESVSPQRKHDEKSLVEVESPLASTRKRSIKRGRSIVHKNMEDNYGAVISANHEALAQILEQVCENRPVPAALKPLAAALNPHFSDFSVLSESEGLRSGVQAFYPATWGSAHLPVTLMVSRDTSLNSSQAKTSFSLNPVAQFVEQIPNYLLSNSTNQGIGTNQGVVWALPRMTILTFSSFSRTLHQRRKNLRMDEFEKEMSFILLQLINGLKSLQAQGTEESRTELDRFLLSKREQDTNYRLIITETEHLEKEGRKMSLCQCALAAMLMMFDIDNPIEVACRERETITLPQILPSVSMYNTMAVILQKDGSVALGQVKSMLEYMLWGPSDIIFEFNLEREAESREESLQRWLDLERATVLNNMIRSQGVWNISLTVYQEYHLLFLVRTCAKMLREASLLFESEVSRM